MCIRSTQVQKSSGSQAKSNTWSINTCCATISTRPFFASLNCTVHCSLGGFIGAEVGEDDGRRACQPPPIRQAADLSSSLMMPMMLIRPSAISRYIFWQTCESVFSISAT
ncbi:hypothetical protein KC19_VG162900 [Ceratodon purpureus]|uniref:Uncharacterized protein n=1 Tax=Ceratodon purpureus TaxID=3225 RepID=A0A8T0HQP2_CERPU|nr:hypothetical protein KC19_VG162900 [Ceratodon purpureus]